MCFRAQQVFKQALRSSVIRLRVIRRSSPSQTIQNETIAPPSNFSDQTDNVVTTESCSASSDVKHGITGPQGNRIQDIATPLVKIPPAVPPRSSSTALSTSKSKFTQISSTRLIGKVMIIELIKGQSNTFTLHILVS